MRQAAALIASIALAAGCSKPAGRSADAARDAATAPPAAAAPDGTTTVVGKVHASGLAVVALEPKGPRAFPAQPEKCTKGISRLIGRRWAAKRLKCTRIRAARVRLMTIPTT